ncbi:MAG: hypothetical protein C4547_13375 [Phycisphaerales bacterium]|nr:MAG: hypothetical protein C4547_13375 [Phycisphaerales bacterium]
MAITPINLSRVTFQTSFAIDVLRANQRELFESQVRISTGRSFVTPSEDPEAALASFRYKNLFARQTQLAENIRAGGSMLQEADNAVNDVNALLIEAQTIASQNLSNLVGADERAAEAELIAAIRQQLVNVGNRTFNGKFIFAGRETKDAPFIDAPGGVAYVGDVGDLHVRIAEGRLESVNVPGNQLFGALSGTVSGRIDLSPVLTADTRLDALGGATGRGVEAGVLKFIENPGAEDALVFTVDVGGADTIGDVAARINEAAAAAGSGLTASVGQRGLQISPDAPVTITDLSSGSIASALGIRTADPITTPLSGSDLFPRITRTTPITALGGGEGVDLAGGLRIVNGDLEVLVDVSEAETVQDVINAINNAGVYVTARINDAGTAIDVYNQVSGTTLSITEGGGSTAADLGLRTMTLGTPLAQLNHGNGVDVAAGKPDLRISAQDGAVSFEVSLDGAVTVGDAIDLINAAAADAGATVRASLAPGGGILIEDTGGGTVSVGLTPFSNAAEDLGLLTTPDQDTGAVLGLDVGAARAEGVLDALIQLERALRGDDDQGITDAGQRLERIIEEVIRVHGVVGARSAGMQSRLQQMEDAAITTDTLLSGVEDLDFAEAITKLESAQTVLQASLLTSSRLRDLSLLDYLR